jgi:N-acetylglucosamine kinase-like BadF-type ATPase
MTSAVLAIDAGGSSTVVRLDLEGRIKELRFPPMNPASVGQPMAEANARACMREVSQIVGTRFSKGCISAAFVQRQNYGRLADRIITAFIEEAPVGDYVFVNDVIPLLIAPPISGEGIVISSGTGSCTIGRDSRGKIEALGGHEYVISDSGSAYAIGLAGLRVAAEAFDGFEGGEALLIASRRFFGMEIPALGRHLSGSSKVKMEVAAFAPSVCGVASAGDDMAKEIIERAATSLAEYACKVAGTLRFEGSVRVGFAGGVITNCRGLADAVRTLLSRSDMDLMPIAVSNLDCVAWLARNGTGMVEGYDVAPPSPLAAWCGPELYVTQVRKIV